MILNNETNIFLLERDLKRAEIKKINGTVRHFLTHLQTKTILDSRILT